VRENFTCLFPHLVCFNVSAITAELGGARASEGSSISTMARVMTYKLLSSSHRAATQVYERPGNAWGPNRHEND